MLGVGIGIGVNRFRAGGVTANGAGQSFNGTDQLAYVADNGDLDITEASTDFCMSAYIKTGTDLTNVQYILGKSVAGLVTNRYEIYLSAGVLSFSMTPSGGNVAVPDNIVLATNTEYHVTIRVDLSGSKIYYYIDGILQNTGGTSFTGSISNLGNQFEFYVGGANSSDGSTEGGYALCTVRDVRVYHKDITAQITELMTGVNLGDEVAWWDLPTLTGFGGTSYNLTGKNL